METLELKSTITEMKSSQMNSKENLSWQRICEFEGRPKEIKPSEGQRKKKNRKKKNFRMR
jgi:hypothetical protein